MARQQSGGQGRGQAEAAEPSGRPRRHLRFSVSTGVLGGRAGEGCTADWCRGQTALPWCVEMGDASPAQRALLCGAVLVQNDGSVMIYQLLLGCPPEHQCWTGLCSQLRGRKVKDEPSSWTAANLKGSSLKALV